MDKQITYKVFSLSRFLGWLFVAVLATGCAQAPKKTDKGQAFEGIYFIENESVDAAVRKDFSAAVELLKQEQYEQAIDLLKKVVKGSQQNSAPYINLAMAYGFIDDLEHAEENLKLALEINPDHPVANNQYALLLRRSGRYAEARELYEKMVQKYPEYMPVRKNYGILCDLYLNDAACALEHYEVYSEANPTDEDIKLWITTIKRKIGS
jgi:Tfp pilus assembly protein PilF